MCRILRGLFSRPSQRETLYVPPQHREARDFINHMQDAGGPHIHKRTVCIYGASYWGCPQILGSGVALDLAGKKFVATAAHVLDPALDNKRAVYLSPGVTGGKWVDLDTCPVHKSQRPADKNRLNDPFDICLIALSDRAIATIGPGIKFTQSWEIDYEQPRERGAYYFVHGYPTENLRVNYWRKTVRCDALPYGSFWYEGERGHYPVPPNGDYLDLDFDPTKSIDRDGRAVQTPSPHGISGCGIWRLSRAGARRVDWSANDIRLVAIEHRWNPTLHVLRGTLFSYVNQIVRNNYPEVYERTHAEWRARQRGNQTR